MAIIVAMSASSIPPDASQDHPSKTSEILRLKRKLATTHQELDEARGGRPKKMP